MNSIRQTQKKYCSRALITAIIIGFVLILAAQKPIAKGLIIGTFASILNFILIGETLPGRIRQSSKKKTFIFSLGSIFLRFALMAVPLVVAIRSEDYNLFAVAAGLFMVQVMILVDHISSLTFSTRQG
ncbi:ATP synthase subunit I [Desulfococcus sp.]|uniref:ATP synthase subunit I n=1 Tax=Desulfococcus sp. TaxID=2025834 RepID=UPI0035931CB1